MNQNVNEQERLKTLQLYGILDTAAEKTFDDLTRLAAAICEAPIGLISLVDEDRQWFKSRTGLDAIETPRSQAFCAHAITSNEIMVVEDATLDHRFVDNPLVLKDPSIRFYAGAPLTVESGHNLGTLCVIDTKPRDLSSLQLESLAILREAVVTQIEFRRAKTDIEQLKSIVPLCAWCDKIRVEQGSDDLWISLNEYVTGHSNVSHGICPDCRVDAEADMQT